MHKFKEGYFYSDHPTNKNYPVPVANDQPWDGQNSFVYKLTNVESMLGIRIIIYRDMSSCRICGCSNGSSEYEYGDWLWTEGLLHYITNHNYKPTDDFIKFINDIEVVDKRPPPPQYIRRFR